MGRSVVVVTLSVPWYRLAWYFAVAVAWHRACAGYQSGGFVSVHAVGISDRASLAGIHAAAWILASGTDEIVFPKARTKRP